MREEEYSHLDKSCDEGGTAPSLENTHPSPSPHSNIPTPNPAYHPLANHYQLTQLAIQCPIPALCGSGDLDKFMVGLD